MILPLLMPLFLILRSLILKLSDNKLNADMNLNLQMALELLIGFIFALRRHIYVGKCKWNRFNKSDSYPI